MLCSYDNHAGMKKTSSFTSKETYYDGRQIFNQCWVISLTIVKAHTQVIMSNVTSFGGNQLLITINQPTVKSIQFGEWCQKIMIIDPDSCFAIWSGVDS